jgi:hypothetical protein
MSKQTFHKFNRTLDQEPEVTQTKAPVGGKRIELPTFEADLPLIEESIPIPTVAPDAADHLKFLFGDLANLLAEEQVNTNPVPLEPTIQNPPATIQPVAEPVAIGIENEEEKEPIGTDPEPERKVSVVEPVSEAKIADIHDVADNLTRPYVPKPVVPPPAPTPAPPPAPVAPPERKGWVFTVHRNRTTNLIERIEADPK